MTVSNKLMGLLKTTRGSKGKVVATEEELHKLFTDNKCSTKTDMIMAMHDQGYKNNDIAATLQSYGVLTEKSAYQMVRNTVDRVVASRVTNNKKSA